MIVNLSIIIKIAVLIVAAAVGYGIQHITHKADTPIEQFAESVIKQQTGLDVDFSAEEVPLSTEDKK